MNGPDREYGQNHGRLSISGNGRAVFHTPHRGYVLARFGWMRHSFASHARLAGHGETPESRSRQARFVRILGNCSYFFRHLTVQTRHPDGIYIVRL